MPDTRFRTRHYHSHKCDRCEHSWKCWKGDDCNADGVYKVLCPNCVGDMIHLPDDDDSE